MGDKHIKRLLNPTGRSDFQACLGWWNISLKEIINVFVYADDYVSLFF